MTNAEKFKAVFGIDFREMSVDMLERPYHKQKKYLYKLYDRWDNDRMISQGSIYAGNKTDAREAAIQALGNLYQRYTNGGWPMYALRIEEGK